MIVVVSDTSPIRALAHLGQLELLQSLFGSVVVPPAVETELEQPRIRGMPVELTELPFIRVQAPSNVAEVQRLRCSLDLGESEALALAQELKAGVLLIDEAAGRKLAEELGFRVIGTCGVLLEAKQRGLISDLKPLIDDLIANLGFFVSQQLRVDVLRIAGETP